MTKTKFFIIIIVVLTVALTLSLVLKGGDEKDTEEDQFGDRSVPVKEGDIVGQSDSLTSLTGSFTGPGSASSTLSWQGGDTLRLNLAAKNNRSTSTVEWQFEFSDDGANWFLDGGSINLASTTATTTLSESGIYQFVTNSIDATTTRSYLFEHIKTTKFLKVSFRHNNSPVVTSKIWAQIIKEEQQ